MSSHHEYTQTLRDIALRDLVADLVKEKVATDSVSNRAQRDLYSVKKSCLSEMGISITRHALAMRVSREFNKSQDTLNRQEIDVAQTTDSMSGLIPVTGLSSDSSSSDNKAGRPKGSTDTKREKKPIGFTIASIL